MDRWICPIPFYPQGLVFGGQSPREPCKTTSIAAASGTAHGLPVCLASSLMLARTGIHFQYQDRASCEEWRGWNGPVGKWPGIKPFTWVPVITTTDGPYFPGCLLLMEMRSVYLRFPNKPAAEQAPWNEHFRSWPVNLSVQNRDSPAICQRNIRMASSSLKINPGRNYLIIYPSLLISTRKMMTSDFFSRR